ncbi:Nif3-like dinuclear metal center hexameric protein [Herminiimonas sp. CN]|uniref:Nif3-like dinuclear metal center hexameric protein n=1 Tax=Herminiimonas sp. CN TaxID=1349818 RepID=UPI000473E09C|nr:Nif3-like dinuclear metal center hexameric protein [Herminiimonas sp. CN]
MNQRSVDRDELAKFLALTLEITRFRDYCPNGLQVTGSASIKTVVTGVTANLALLEAAIDLRADAVLVHHGYFWRGEDACVVGIKHKRLKLLLAHDINLFAYHLPLDAHPVFGNNAQLASILGLLADARFGADDLACLGTAINTELRTAGDWALEVAAKLGRQPLLIGDPAQPVRRVAWCTGAAQNFMTDAIAAGADMYLSGEISEPTVHLAREAGVAYLACGHHATERYGVQALGQLLAQQFGIAHHFVDIDNPV